MVTLLWFEMHCVENGFTGVGRKKPGVGADHNLKLDLIGSSKSPSVWIFRTYVQSVCERPKPQLQKQHVHTCTHGRDAEDTWKNREWAITVTTKSEKHHFTFSSLERRVSHLIILHSVRLRSRSAGSETPSSSFPPWPGNYPNLPSSCAAAPVPHWLRPPLWLHYQCWSSLMARRPHCAETDRGGGGSKRWRRRRRRRRTGRRGMQKLDTKEQRLPWRFGSLKSHCSSMEDEAIGQSSVKEEVRRSAKGLSAGQHDHVVCVCVFEVTGRHVHVCSLHAPTLRVSNSYNLTTYRRTGGGDSVSLFFFSDKWHPDSWKKKCWGPWTDFSVTKIKCVGLDKDRHLHSTFEPQWEHLTNATPPPLRLCHDCFFFSLQKCHKT